MGDKSHPGVKSLLARFENSQQPSASPPPRDRSPAGSDNLSKVRASFVAVEGGGSNPALGVRRISPQGSDAPSSPSRVKSFSSEDLDGSVKSSGSPTQPTNGFGSPQKVNEPEKKEPTPEAPEPKGKEKAVDVTSANKENQPATKSPTTTPSLAAKPTKTVSKRPSNAQVGKTSTTNKPASQAPGSKTTTQSRTSTTATKHDSERTARTRVSRPATTAAAAKNDSKAPVHKPSRTSLATTTKPATRPARSSTPARENTKPAARTGDVRSSSKARPARAPNSTSTSSAAKPNTGSGLTRKPSTLKSAGTGARPRAVTPTASSARKQASHSPPSGSDRPHSRSSTASRPVDEGFLARMMRPTASSASKTHEKADVKSPPRAKVSRAPQKVSPRSAIRSSQSAKETPSTKVKVVSKKPSEVEQHSASEQAPAQSEPEPKAEPVQHTPIPEPSVKTSIEPSEPTVEEEKPSDVTATAVESVAEEPATESVEQPSNGLNEAPPAQPEQIEPKEIADEAVSGPTASQEVDGQTEPTEAPVEQTPNIPEEKVLAPAAEIVEKPAEPENAHEVDTTQAVEPTDSGESAVPQEKPEITSEAPAETETKPNETDVDLSKLSLQENLTF